MNNNFGEFSTFGDLCSIFIAEFLNDQARESPKDAPVYESEVGSSGTTNGATDAVQKLEPESEFEARKPNVTNRFLVYLAIIVLLLSSLASYIFNEKSILSGVDI